ncbi:hypothetical protein O0L34_g14978 [Tuta absoluta]|nr:hypothetical protein O0L34_g14978 [Tuta absoluta]
MAQYPETSATRSNECDSKDDLYGDIEQSQVFSNVTSLIKKDLADMKAIHENINRMREKVANLEWMLLSKVSSSTWQEVSELIGLSGANVLQECFKILDEDVDRKSS